MTENITENKIHFKMVASTKYKKSCVFLISLFTHFVILFCNHGGSVCHSENGDFTFPGKDQKASKK